MRERHDIASGGLARTGASEGNARAMLNHATGVVSTERADDPAVTMAELDPSVSYWRGFYADARNGDERLRTFGGALAGLDARGRWLDAGCGIGVLARQFRATGLRVTGIDISGPRLAEAAQITGLPVVRGGGAMPAEHLREASVDDLPYADAAFDGAYSSSVLEYVPDLERALVELARVVRRDGHLVFNLPNTRSIFRRLYAVLRANSAYSRIAPRRTYTPAAIAAALARTGWEPIDWSYYGAERDVPGIPVLVPSEVRARLVTRSWVAPFILIVARRC